MEWISIHDGIPKSGQHIWTWNGKDVEHWIVNAAWGKTDEQFKKQCEKYKMTHWMKYIEPKPPENKQINDYAK